MISGIIKVEVKVLPAETKAEADNNYRDLDYSGYNKTEASNCLVIHHFDENNDKHTVARNTV